MNYDGNKLYRNFVGGGISGVSSLTVIYPTERLKTQMQFGKGVGGVWGTVRDVIKRNGWKGLFRGYSSSASASYIRFSTKFGIYEWAKWNLDKTGFIGKDASAFLSGLITGGVISVICSPMGNMNIRAIHDQVKGGGVDRKKAAADLYRESGIRGFFRGMGPSVMKEGTSYAFRFLFYENIHREILEREWIDRGVSSAMVAGASSSMLGAAVNHPLDVIQTRMRGNYDGVYRNSLDCIRKTIGLEGVAGLYHGVSLRVLRTIPGMAVTFGVYEAICGKKKRGRN